MPIYPTFNNKIIYITASPVAASDINSVLATQNTAGFWATDIRFTSANDAFILFVKTNTGAYGDSADQKVNLISGNQAALDADAGIEAGAGYYPTGIFPTPGGSLLVFYTLLDTGGGGE